MPIYVLVNLDGAPYITISAGVYFRKPSESDDHKSLVMVQDVTIGLGSFTISSSTDKSFCLTVSTEMSLSYPDNLPVVSTAVELWDQVKNGLLWITRAGSCRFELSIYFDEPVDDFTYANFQGRKREAVEEAFQTFPAWNTLGLDLRPEVNVFKEELYPHETFVYSMQHTRQQSGLFTPEGVACGGLSLISSTLRFGAQRTRPGNKPNNDSRIVTLKAPPHELQRITGILVQPSEFGNLPLDLQAERLKHLTHNALNLVVGLKKKPTGVRVLKPSRSPTLLDLAPAVMNSTYFQDAVARAQLAPAISSALANMTSTQSPLLRQKVGELVQQQGPDPQVEDVAGELHKKILVLLLQTTYVQRTKLRSIIATRQHGTQLEVPIQNDQISELDALPYASLDNDGEAPTSGPLQEYGPSNDGVLDDLDECLGYSENNKEQELVPFGRMSYSSGHPYGETDEAYFRQRNDLDPKSMGADDLVEDTLLYTTGAYDPEYHPDLPTPDATGHAFLREEMYLYASTDHSEEVRGDYRDLDDMDEEEELLGPEYHLTGGKEVHLKHQLAIDDTGTVDLSAGTFIYAARVQDGNDNEMSFFEEERAALIRASRDSSYGRCDTDGAFEYSTLHDEDAYSHLYHVKNHGQGEGGVYEGSGQGHMYHAQQDHAQDGPYAEVMPSVSNMDIEIIDMPYS